MRPDDSAIRRRRAFSSAPETLARCFFKGLPRKASVTSPVGGAGSDGFTGVALGGVMERPVIGGGVVPDAGVSLEVAPPLEGGSAEC